MIRKVIFWAHLCTGVVTGLVVAMMSFTGVLIAYEHQLIRWSDKAMYQPVPEDEARLSIIEIVNIAKSEGVQPSEVIVYKDPTAPALATTGRRGPRKYINAYTGEVYPDPDNQTRRFLQAVEAWHRWFAASGDNQKVGRAITGAANLGFLFLLFSGIYLWLPKIFRWGLLKSRILLRREYPNSKARDFHWHHILGFWCVIPLIIIVSTAVVFSYPWANDLVFKMAGEAQMANQRPQRSAVNQPRPTENSSDASGEEVLAAKRQTIEQLIEITKQQNPGWKSLEVNLPDASDAQLEIKVDTGSGQQPHKAKTLTFDRQTGAVDAVEAFGDSSSPGRRAWIIIRFLHTGEVFGVMGQTIAMLVSLLSLVMVYTGLALAWRRLIVPLMRKRAKRI